MKIDKISFNKNNYVLKIDDNEYIIDDFYYKVLYPYNEKEIDKDTLLTICAFSKANEILKKLYKKVFASLISEKEFILNLKDVLDEFSISKIVNTLKNEGYLDDTKVIEYYFDKYQKDKGVHYFKNKMQEIGISSELISRYSQMYIENEPYAKQLASKIINSKETSIARQKQLVFASLMNKGFSSKIINNVLLEIEFKSDFKSLKKDYNKIKSDYQCQKIISKLASKGYNIKDIKKVIQEDDGNENI